MKKDTLSPTLKVLFIPLFLSRADLSSTSLRTFAICSMKAWAVVLMAEMSSCDMSREVSPVRSSSTQESRTVLAGIPWDASNGVHCKTEWCEVFHTCSMSRTYFSHSWYCSLVICLRHNATHSIPPNVMKGPYWTRMNKALRNVAPNYTPMYDKKLFEDMLCPH